jgi:cytochrome c oxidase subunit 3
MALAVRAAQCNQQRQLVLFLSLTLVCGVDFLAVKYVEYSHKLHEHLVWGRGFYQGAHAAALATPAEVELVPGDPAHGLELFGASCAACHGREAEGMEKLGPSLRDNAFALSLDDLGLVAFLKKGRSVEDPLNRTGVMMPPKGGNPLLKDQDLMDVVAHLRTLESGRPPREVARKDELAPGGAPPPASAAMAAAAGSAPFASVIPKASLGPKGLASEKPQGESTLQSASFVPPGLDAGQLPPNAHIFFAIYFCMTGLHGIHVLVGLGLLLWLRARAVRGDFGTAYYTPVELGGLYWHLVDIIWIFLFPLFYLI